MGVKSSAAITIGARYSRDQLKAQFSIRDATINTGIFRPAGHDSVWLFVTEEKTSDRTQYEDHLDGDNLYFEGQTAGRTDSLIQEHVDRGLELLVFHRAKKNEFADHSFRYEGPFEFVVSEPGPPTRFHLRRCSANTGFAAILECVSTPQQLHENIRRFNREAAANSERMVSILRQTKYWVFDEDEGWFGPSKFVGFRNMTFGKYDAGNAGQSTGAKFNGGVTRSAIEGILGEFGPDDGLATMLVDWFSSMTSQNALQGVDQSKWRFVRLPHVRNYWALLCNPKKFAGLEASLALDEMVWTVDRGEPVPGDRVLIWQAKAGGDQRGVVAVGEVTHGSEVIPSPPEEHSFWREPVMGPQPRIRFRILRFPGMPLWEKDTPWLSELAVARAHGGTVFTLEPDQWHAIVRTAGGTGAESETAVRRSAEGQRFMLSAAARRAVELHAQGMVEEHFVGLNYEVEDVSTTQSYDLRCTRNGKELHIEVKGTTSQGKSVFLTRNEVEHARQNSDHMVLAIVSDIELVGNSQQPAARGGKLRLIWPWDVDCGTLSPTQFEYAPPL